MRAQKCGNLCLAIVFFLWGCSDEGGSLGVSSPEMENVNNEEIVSKKPSCDFEIVVTEGDFCVIEGTARDFAITLASTQGICEGMATLSVKGFPPGAKHNILPSPNVEFTRGFASATVRVDAVGLSLDQMATSTLTFAAKKEGITRTTESNLKIDLPVFDFSLKVKPNVVFLHQEDSASTTVKVNLLGSACRNVPPVRFLLDDSSLPAFIRYELPSGPITLPGKTTVVFKASSGSDIGTFKTTLVGCCTDGDEKEKKAEISLNVTFPSLPEPGAEFLNTPRVAGKFSSVPMEDMFKIFNLPPNAQKETREALQDFKTKGYIEASESDVAGLKETKRTLIRPMNQLVGRLSFKPAPLENTLFKQFKLEGGFYLGGSEEEGEWTVLTRLFTMPDGALVELAELDYVTSGSGGVYAQENINENINGYPARLTILQSPSGKAITSMEWETERIAYALAMEGNIRKNGKHDLFFALARSIPLMRE